jgi:hypothetical protein
MRAVVLHEYGGPEKLKFESHPEALAELYVPLDSCSSHQGAPPHPHLPMSEQPRCSARDARNPAGRSSKMVTQLLVFPFGPQREISIQFAHRRIKCRATGLR